MKRTIIIVACIISLIVLLGYSLVFGQETTGKSIAKASLDFEKHKLNRSNQPEIWEDGMRTSGGKGTYEWWYFDAHLEDGTTVVLGAYTKHINKINKGLKPMFMVDITKPDGEKILKLIEYEADVFSANKDSCNVKIVDNYFRGNLKEYEIHFEDEELNITARLHRTTNSWRPKTGIIEFGEDEEDYFAWVVAVPQGHAEIEYTYKGDKVKMEGSGYHDHNWGNKPMNDLFNHWYWARAEIGPYNVIASEMIAEKDYNNESIIVFNVSKDGETIVDNEELVKAYRTHGKMHPTLNKDISDEITFVYENPENKLRYEVNLYREKNIVEADLLATTTGGKNLKYRIARLLTRFDGAYFRFTGIAEIKVFDGDKLIEVHSSPTAIWELMYFGKP